MLSKYAIGDVFISQASFYLIIGVITQIHHSTITFDCIYSTHEPTGYSFFKVGSAMHEFSRLLPTTPTTVYDDFPEYFV